MPRLRSHNSPNRFLALGDSYTIGEGVEPAASWPMQLVGRLRSEGWPIHDPSIIAKTGWTTDELLEAIAREQPRGTFDLVSLLIGVNNQYRGRDVDNYRMEFKALVNMAVRFAGHRPENTVVLSIPDWGVTPFAEGRDRALIATEIDRFNQVNRRESETTGVYYIDVTSSSRHAVADPELVTGDGLHPSGKQYAEWVDIVIRKIFRKR